MMKMAYKLEFDDGKVLIVQVGRPMTLDTFKCKYVDGNEYITDCLGTKLDTDAIKVVSEVGLHPEGMFRELTMSGKLLELT